MPEGPSLVILKEEVQQFVGQTILDAAGNSKIGKTPFIGQPVIDFKTWGKHFLICLPGISIRIHFLLFGKYAINQPTKATPRLHLHFANGDLYFYTASIKILEDDLDEIYDWSADIMSNSWNAVTAP